MTAGSGRERTLGNAAGTPPARRRHAAGPLRREVASAGPGRAGRRAAPGMAAV